MNQEEEIEIEVFRLMPEVGKYYETVLLTRTEGKWPNNKYYTTNTPEYVGNFLEQQRYGCRDSSQTIDIFENEKNEEVPVHYTYEGTTAYREVECRLTKKQKLAILHVGREEDLPSEITQIIIKKSTSPVEV